MAMVADWLASKRNADGLELKEAPSNRPVISRVLLTHRRKSPRQSFLDREFHLSERLHCSGSSER
jgi:hypothetical protein